MMAESYELEQLVQLEEDLVEDLRKRDDGRTCWTSCSYLGIVLAIFSSFFFSLSSVIVKWMVDVDPMLLAFSRFIGVLLPTLPVLIYRKESVFPRGKRIMLLLRSFVGTSGLMLSFYAFRHMPLADASVVVFSVPVFVGIFAKLFLNEPCGWFHSVTVILTLIGVVFITRPPAIFNSTASATPSEYNFWGAVAAIAATLFGANVYILLRALKGLHFSVIMTNFGCFAIFQSFTITYLTGNLCIPKCGVSRILVLALALFSFAGQILLTMSLQLEQAGPVAIARSADIVFAFFWQILFFNEVPNALSMCGATLVTSCVILTGVRKWVVSLPNQSSIKKAFIFLAK